VSIKSNKRESHLEERGGNLLFLQALLTEVNLNRHSRILEIGCGTGVLAEYLGVLTGAEILGTELSEESARIANQRISCYHCPTGELPSNIGYFDLIFCKDVLPTIEDKRWFFKAIRSLLKPQGTFCTYMPNDIDFLTKPLFRFIPGSLSASQACYGSIAETIELLSECGFRQTQTFRISLGTVPMDERYVHKHWDGYFSNSDLPEMSEGRIHGLNTLLGKLKILLDFGILAHYKWERTMLVAR
jgi:2-polyprenyl-3-methyl-5-hydroxy-6-metoxy-1,4-benzoquinol methylase